MEFQEEGPGRVKIGHQIVRMLLKQYQPQKSALLGLGFPRTHRRCVSGGTASLKRNFKPQKVDYFFNRKLRMDAIKKALSKPNLREQ
jgi:hypothetical protein